MKLSWFILLLLVFCCGGCGSSSKDGRIPLKDLDQFGSLPGLQETHSPFLKKELEQLLKEKATPQLLMTAGVGGDFDHDQRNEDNVAYGLAKVFEAADRKLLENELKKLYPKNIFQYGSFKIQEAIEFRIDHESQRMAFREALSRKYCDFRLQHDRGLNADLSFIKIAWLCNRLEGLKAAESLFVDENPQEAIKSLDYMFQMIEHLGRQKHLAFRLRAANLRLEAFYLVEAIASHEKANRETHRLLLKLVTRQLADWPPDENAWIGDRAQGLHSYEMIRDGHIEVIFPEEVLDIHEKEEGLGNFINALALSFEADELFYVKSMRKVIEGCSDPYYKNKPVLNEIYSRINQLRNTTKYPIIADMVLLVGVREGRRAQARDRALCEAWALALAKGANEALPQYTLNPLTGKPYLVEPGKTRVEVSAIFQEGIDYKIILPIPRD